MFNTFKERFLYVLEISNCSKSKAAEKLNVSPAYISQLSSGIREPSDRTISDICRIFGIQEDWLRHGLEPMRAAKTREEEISELVGAALTGSNDFKRAVIRMICTRTDKELEALEAALRAVYENIEKEKNQGV